MQTGSTLVRVVPNSAGGWDIREPGSGRPLSRAPTKDKAVLRARAAMLSAGTVQVLGADGLLLQTYLVSGPSERPWWYIPSRPLFWVAGVLFVLQGVLGLTGSRPGEFGFWLGLAVGLMGVFYLVLIAVSHRRDRRLLHAEQLCAD